MAMSIDRVISTLNDLIETCKDGEQGFQLAADNIQDKELESLFNSYSHQRSDFAAELQQQVIRLGGDPEKRGSVAGAMHRGWINIRSVIKDHKAEDILAECERGEDIAVSNYHDVLAQDLPDAIRAILDHQYRSVQEAHDRIRTLQRSNLRYRADKPSFNY